MIHSFRAMGTTVTLVLPEGGAGERAQHAAAVERAFEQAEQRYSRFRPDSELSRLNAAAAPMAVSEALFAMLVRCRAHVEATGGVFDPSVGATLEALGYDRSFAPGALDRMADVPLGRDASARPSLLDVRLDAETRTVTLPPGVHLDLGGIAKGATVDAVSAGLPANAALDAGGDLVVRGAGPEGEGWPVEVEDPRDPTRALGLFVVTDVGVATSAANRRRWRVGPDERHHLVDPRTGTSAASDLAQVTIVARSAEEAEVCSKTVFVLGLDAGRAWLDRKPGVRGVLVDGTGGIHTIGGVVVLSAG